MKREDEDNAETKSDGDTKDVRDDDYRHEADGGGPTDCFASCYETRMTENNQTKITYYVSIN